MQSCIILFFFHIFVDRSYSIIFTLGQCVHTLMLLLSVVCKFLFSLMKRGSGAFKFSVCSVVTLVDVSQLVIHLRTVPASASSWRQETGEPASR